MRSSQAVDCAYRQRNNLQINTTIHKYYIIFCMIIHETSQYRPTTTHRYPPRVSLRRLEVPEPVEEKSGYDYVLCVDLQAYLMIPDIPHPDGGDKLKACDHPHRPLHQRRKRKQAHA